MWRNQKSQGQSTAEYAVLVAVVIAGIIATQVYVKRSIQGRAKQASDQIGEQFDAANSDWEYTTENHSSRGDKVDGAGTVTSTITKDNSKRTGSEHVTSSVTGSLFSK